MLREIARACEDASWDDDIRAVVVTGTGRAFCVGADLRSWDEDLLGNSSEYWKWFGAFKDMHDRLREIGKPTIARVNGIAVGGGNELQMACDLSVMVDTAFIRHVGLQHGSVPAGGATQWLQLMVGDRRAREIVFLCDEIPAAQAAEWGLVNRAVPEAELDAVVDEWVEKLAAKLPQTTRYAKQQLNVWRDLAWHQTVGHARDWLAMSMLGDGGAGRGARVPRPRKKRVGSPMADEVLTVARRRRSDDHAQPARRLQRDQPRDARRARGCAARRQPTRRSAPSSSRARAAGSARGRTSASSSRFPAACATALEQTYHPNVRAIRALEKPVIAAINGARRRRRPLARVRVRRPHRLVGCDASCPASSGSGSFPTRAARGSSTACSGSRGRSSGWSRIGD